MEVREKFSIELCNRILSKLLIGNLRVMIGNLPAIAERSRRAAALQPPACPLRSGDDDFGPVEERDLGTSTEWVHSRKFRRAEAVLACQTNQKGQDRSSTQGKESRLCHWSYLKKSADCRAGRALTPVGLDPTCILR